jgi:hypothetical protein
MDVPYWPWPLLSVSCLYSESFTQFNGLTVRHLAHEIYSPRRTAVSRFTIISDALP